MPRKRARIDASYASHPPTNFEIPPPGLPQRPEPQAAAVSKLTCITPGDRPDPTRRLLNAIEDRHRAVGAYLKTVEAHLTHLRCTVWLGDREVTKALDNINKAIQDARPVLDRRRCNGGFYSVRPGGDAYYGPEIDALHKLAYEIDTARQIFQEQVRTQRKAIRQTRSIEPVMREMEREQLYELANARFQLPDETQQELDDVVTNVIAAAKGHPLLPPGAAPVALDAPAVGTAAVTDRHAGLRAALLENPTNRKRRSSSSSAFIPTRCDGQGAS